jgi:hypothetical protein
VNELKIKYKMEITEKIKSWFKWLKEQFIIEVQCPKTLWFFILGMYISAFFKITIPIEWSFFPVLFIALAEIALTGKNDEGRDYGSAIASIIGALIIFVL